MDTFLNDKVALVTGGSRGIGRAIAQSLHGAGASVAICGRSRDSVDRAVEQMGGGERLAGAVADVRRDEDVEKLFSFVDERFGGLDILVNNAGVGIFKPVGELTPEEFRAVLDTNLTGVFLCCKQAIPRFGNRGGGFIVNISSLAGKNSFASGAAYNASKFGLNGFSEAMMLDHRYDKIRVSYVMPGSVNTEFRYDDGKMLQWKIAAEDVAGIVLTILRMPERTLISRVEVRPAIPPRK